MGRDGGAFYGWLSTNDDGLLIAQIRPAVPAVDLRQFLVDGGQTFRQWTTPSAATTISVSGVGNRWAVAWVAPSGSSSVGVSCVTSADPTTVDVIDAGISVDEVSIAISSIGGTGIAARDTNGGIARIGAARSGCVTGFIPMRGPPMPMYPTGVGATLLPGQVEVADFRFAAVDDGNLYSGTHGVFGFGATDGGVRAAEYFQFGDPSYDLSAAMSGDGQSLMISYMGRATDGGWALNGKSMPTDFTSPSAIGRELMPDVRFWGSALCGPSCFVTTGVLRNAPTSLRASFVSADTAYADLAGGQWDLACARSSSPTNAIPAVAFGKLHVLYSDPTRNELHVCDLPPGL